MEKIGHILLLCVNILIDVFLIGVFIFGLVWLISGEPPREALIKVMQGVEKTWHSVMDRIF